MNLLNGHIRQGWDEINVYGLILRMSEFEAEPNNYLSTCLPVGRYLYLGCWIVLKVDFQASKQGHVAEVILQQIFYVQRVDYRSAGSELS